MAGLGRPVRYELNGSVYDIPKLTVADWLDVQDKAMLNEKQRLLEDCDACGVTNPGERLEAVRNFHANHTASGVALLWMSGVEGARYVVEKALGKMNGTAPGIDEFSPISLSRLAGELVGLGGDDTDSNEEDEGGNPSAPSTGGA